MVLVQVLYRDGGSPGVVKAIHGLHLEHEDSGAIEDDQQDQHRKDTHKGYVTQVALTVVGRSKESLTERTTNLSLCTCTCMCVCVCERERDENRLFHRVATCTI